MKEVNIHEAKTHLSRLLQRVAAGEEITIANRGTPVARLVPAARPRARGILGIARGQFTVPEDFDAPLPPEVLAGFLGEEEKPKRRKR
jgi:prevent-host-death family protein